LALRATGKCSAMAKLTKKQRARIKNSLLKLAGWLGVVLILYGKEVIYLLRYNFIRISSYTNAVGTIQVAKNLRNIRDPNLLLKLEIFREYRLHWWIAVVIFLVVLMLANLFNSQFLLPVTSWKDRYYAFANFFSFMFGSLGPLVFVKDGKIISHLGEKERKGPGVALVYSNNAVAIGSRVHGPGVVFTWKQGKKVSTVLDLRKQVRTRGRGNEEGLASEKVRAVTRDGIEIETDIEVQFSISAPPEIVYLTFTGKGDKKEDLRFLQMNHAEVITEISECKFTEEEMNEIFHTTQHLLARDLESIPFVDLADFARPSMYNHDRVQECFSNQPRGADGNKIDWHELPISVAVEEFRNTIVRFPFDELFLPPDYSDLVYDDFFGPLDEAQQDSTRVMAVDYFHQQSRFPLEKVRREYANSVQHSGFVAYHLVKKVGREEVKLGDRLQDLMKMSVHPILLNSPQPLRRSRITVTSVQFGELDPINPQIPEQTVANLIARWDTEAIKTRVGFEEKAAVIRSNAKAQVQQDTVYALRDMLMSSNKAKTAMILRIFQALEAATMESENKELTNMIKMLGDIRKWFNISGSGQGEKS